MDVTEDVLKSLFSSLDAENKGYLEEADLAPLVQDDQQQDAVKLLMQQLDVDQDGMVGNNSMVKFTCLTAACLIS